METESTDLQPCPPGALPEMSDAPAEAAWSPRAIGGDTIGYEAAAPWLQVGCGLDIAARDR